MASPDQYNQSNHLITTYRQDAIESILTDRIVGIEFANFFLGNYLGHGVSRHVFEYAPDPKKWVIKIDCSSFNANALEYDVWGRVEHMPRVRQWLAPIKKMSRCGRVLMMARADMNRPREDYPKRIPGFLFDVKYENYGFIGKQLVCIDYAGAILEITKRGTIAMYDKKAVWVKTNRV